MSREILPGIKQFDLSGRSAVITGGSKGLGLAMAAGLASAGARIMLVNRNAEEGIRAARELSADYGVKALSFGADITDRAQTEAMAKVAVEAFGKIDILINNAGHSIRRSIAASYQRLHDFERLMKLNYFAAVRLTLALLNKKYGDKSICGKCVDRHKASPYYQILKKFD